MSVALGHRRNGAVEKDKDLRTEEGPRGGVRASGNFGFLGVLLMVQLLQLGILSTVAYLLMRALRIGSVPEVRQLQQVQQVYAFQGSTEACKPWCPSPPPANCSSSPPATDCTDCSICASKAISSSLRPSGGSSSIGGYTPPQHSTCALETLGGRPSDGYGSWPLCSDQVPPNATVYSFGIGGDISFDLAMIRRGARIFAFDPTVTPERAQALFVEANASALNASFSFMQLGLGASNGVVSFFRSRQPGIGSMTSIKPQDVKWWKYQTSGFQAAVLTLPTIMAALKHDHIDLLKVDVEGVEFDVCDTQEFLDALDKVGQVIYEFHERMLKTAWGRKLRCIKALQAKGFQEVKRTYTQEYVFARMKPNATIMTLPQRLPWVHAHARHVLPTKKSLPAKRALPAKKFLPQTVKKVIRRVSAPGTSNA